MIPTVNHLPGLHPAVAKVIRDLVHEVQLARKVSAAPPLQVTVGPMGTMLRSEAVIQAAAERGNAALLKISAAIKNPDGTQNAVFIDGGEEGESAKVYNRYTTAPAIAVDELVDGVLKTGGPEIESDVPIYAIAYRLCP